MKKNFSKLIGLIIVTLFLSSPIITSISIPNESITTEGKIKLRNCLNPDIQAAIDMINESMLREFLTVLSVEIGIRFTGSYGAEKAAEYIYNVFSGTGLETRYDYWDDWVIRIPPNHYKDKNVEATLEGKDETCDEIIVFNAHYDTVKAAPGAVDDGTGVVAVMAAAYALSHFQFNRTIKFVTFSGEEVGLVGSRNYVRDLYKDGEEILVQFNADMIGYANTAEEGRTAYLSKSKDASWIIDEINYVNENYGIDFNLTTRWNLTADGNLRYGSDYFDFVKHGYESVAFWESGRFPYMHTPEDTIEKVNFSYLTNMTRLIAASIAHMADIDVYYPQVQIGSPKRGAIYNKWKKVTDLKHEHTIVLNEILLDVDVKPGDSPIEKVEYYYDGKLINTDTEMPYQYRLNERSLNFHTIEVIVHDEKGRKASDEVTFLYFNLLKNK